ncbi:hypothetical protein N7541_003285 [Penicillium brevicompactum]|uniref:Uncharacterized protein n=1 Tax=Penicillium brevicompactum TaxID=5074 RepID=A0A9W9V182_PENBR|nr:hypothetical protein N7541_003285 [Penicillium brevicompactum]
MPRLNKPKADFVDEITESTEPASPNTSGLPWDDLPSPIFAPGNGSIPDLPPGDWARIAKACLWPCSKKLVGDPKQLLFFLSSQSQKREPVLVEGRQGGQCHGNQNGRDFATSVGKKKANVEALLSQTIGDFADVKCSHCARGCGRFSGCVLIRTPENEVLACTNCHWNNHSDRCSLSTIGRALEKHSQDAGADQESGIEKEDDQEMIDFVTSWLPVLKHKLAKARRGSPQKRLKGPQYEKKIKLAEYVLALKAKAKAAKDSKNHPEQGGHIDGE